MTPSNASQTEASNIRARIDKANAKLGKVSAGGHLGGTHFGQVGGDAKTKQRGSGGGRPRSSQGRN